VGAGSLCSSPGRVGFLEGAHARTGAEPAGGQTDDVVGLVAGAVGGGSGSLRGPCAWPALAFRLRPTDQPLAAASGKRRMREGEAERIHTTMMVDRAASNSPITEGGQAQQGVRRRMPFVARPDHGCATG